MLRKGRRITIISLVLLSVILMTACSNTAKDDNNLVVAQDRDATSLDPHGSNDEASSSVRAQIFNNLVSYTEERELVGDLAEDWEMVNDTTWVFKLREGVKFHNGEELTPEDVKFSLERSMTTPLVSHILEEVKEVNIKEDGRIEVVTKEPYAPLMANLANPAAAILNKKAIEESGEEAGQEPVGTGPYKFVSWDAGDRIFLERFDDYFGEKAKIEKIEFRIIPEGNNRTIGLETGELDIAYGIDPVNINILEENDDLEYVVNDSFAIHYLGFNTQKEPVSDVRVRQAIAYAIDMEEIAETVLYNTVAVADSLLNSNVIGAGGEYENYPYNPEKAKELLKEAGFEDGLDLKLYISDNDIRVRNSEIIQGQLKNVGINLGIEMLEWGAFLDAAGRGDHDMFLLAATVSTGDADNPLSLLLHSDQLGEAGNRSFYDNPTVDRLIEEARRELNPERRVEIYNEIQVIINQDLPLYPLYFNNQNAGINKRVKGFKLNPAGYHFLNSVYFED